MSTTSHHNTAVLILAAGSSSRMRRSKQLLPVGTQPLLRKTLMAARAIHPLKIIIVLGAYEEEHRAVLQEGTEDIITNSEWEKGMGNSIRFGIKHIAKDAATEGVLILVCDQPLLTSGHLLNLVNQHRNSGKPIVASWYAQSPGVPAFFEKRFFNQLLELDDGSGAKKIMQKFPSDLATVDFPEGRIDLDTPEDYDRFLKEHPQPK